MNTGIVTEVVDFTVTQGIKDEDFIEIVDFLERNFHSQQSGFIDSELIKGKNDRQWLMIQHWRSMEEVKEVVKMMMKSSLTEKFRQAIDSQTVRMSLLIQTRKWIKKQ